MESIWFFRYSMSNFKATYGRKVASVGGDDSYSKDYLQVSGRCREEFEGMLGRPIESGEGVNFTYKWPGGEMEGTTRHPNDRIHLRWPTSGQAPAPWRLAPTITPDSIETFEGNPNFATTAEATEEWRRIEALNLDRWLIIVKLADEEKTLHLRAYLGNPPPHLAHASAELLPIRVRDAMRRLPKGSSCDVISFQNQKEPSQRLHALLETLSSNPNVLLVGPPGTGKTVLLEELARHVEQGDNAIWFDPDRNHDAFAAADRPRGKTRTVVFHPSYSYQDLVLGLLPRAGANGGVDVQVTTGPLVNLAHYAQEPGRLALLVIDEFNRGNAAAVLGDFLALLDLDKRSDLTVPGSGATVDLPYGDLDIHVPEEFAANGQTKINPRFSLPKGLWIVAAMNSSDRSVAPLDAALRRRFSILDVPPDYDALRKHLDVVEVSLPQEFEAWKPDHMRELSVQLLTNLNDRLEAVLGRDFLLGQSGFWRLEGETRDDILRSLSQAVDLRVVPTLRMMFVDHDEALAVVLRAGAKDSVTVEASNSQVCYWSVPGTDLGEYGYARLRFNALAEMSHENAWRELRRLTGT